MGKIDKFFKIKIIIAIIAFILFLLWFIYYPGFYLFRKDLGNKYSKYLGKIHYYSCESYGDYKIMDVDIKTFEVTDFYYAKDKNNIYIGCKKLEGADSDTFRKDTKCSMNGLYFTDKNNVYYSDYTGDFFRKIEDADSKTFYSVSNKYCEKGDYENEEKCISYCTLGMDKNNCYLDGEKIDMLNCEEALK